MNKAGIAISDVGGLLAMLSVAAEAAQAPYTGVFCLVRSPQHRSLKR